MGGTQLLTDPTFFDDDSDDEQRAVAGVVSPAPAQALVAPPPDTPPRTGPAQSTVLTGNLAMPPQQAQPKRSGPDMLPGRAALPEQIQAASPSGSLQPAATSMLQPATQSNPGSPASGISSSVPRTVIRDLNGKPAGSPLSMLPASFSTQNSGLQPASAGAVPSAMPLDRLPRQQAFRMQAYSASPVAAAVNAPAPLMPASIAGTGLQPAMPALPNGGLQPAVQGPSQLDVDQDRLNQIINAGSGISRIQNPVGRGAARVGDIALRVFAPGVEPLIPGTEGNYQMRLGQQQQRVGNDQAQQQAAAQLANTQSQMNERDAMGRRYDAQANYYNPEPLSAGQAQTLGHPEWEGLKLDARDAERLVGGAARNQTTLQTHFGGQQRTLSADDAAAIGTPSLEGASMSNDEYQRLLQGAQHNQQWDTNNQRTTNQSDINNQRNNSTRITTTGMRDQASEDNSNRAHPGAGAPKPIPAGVRDRIESQKATAINKARTAFDNGESSMDDYLDNWQQAQNDYEDRIQAQTGQPVQHLDIRSNVDANGNWRGDRQHGAQPAAAQPQGSPAAKPGTFVTQKGSHVAIGDPVNVNGRKGTVTGFNPQTGKAQVRWAGAN